MIRVHSFGLTITYRYNTLIDITVAQKLKDDSIRKMINIFSADRDPLLLRLPGQRFRRVRVLPEEVVQAVHMDDPAVRGRVAQGHLPGAEHHVLGLAMHDAGHSH